MVYDGYGDCWVRKTPDKIAKEEDSARTMERKALDEQDREFFVESELSGVHSRSQYLKVILGND